MRQHDREILAGNVLHYQELPISFIKMIADARQRLMVHSRQQTRFSLELFAEFFVCEKRFLQRHGSVETLVHRLIHGPHSALAELANNPVALLQNCICCQHKSIRSLRRMSLSFRARPGQDRVTSRYWCRLSIGRHSASVATEVVVQNRER